jgi:ligand-binding sensor domain-containing protein
MKWISFVNIILLVTFSISHAQEIERFNFETISDDINNTILDSSGLYWIATSEGLNMFDGNKMHSFFSNLSQQNTILNNSIDNIIELDNLDLVFISKDGLSVFNRSSYDFKRVRIKSPISLVSDKENQLIYVTTAQDGIYQLDSNYSEINHFITDPLNPFTLSSNVFSSGKGQKTIKKINKKGDLAIATEQDINIYDFESGNFRRFISSRTSDYEVNSIGSLDQKNIIIGRNNGLEILNLSSGGFTKLNGYENEFINDILVIDKTKESFQYNRLADYKDKSVFFIFILSKNSLSRISLDENFKVNSSIKLLDNVDSNLSKISISENYLFVWGKNYNRVLRYNFFGEKLSDFRSDFDLNGICVDYNENLVLSSINGLFFSKPNLSIIEPPEFLHNNSLGFKSVVFYKRIDQNNRILIDQNKIYFFKNNKKIKEILLKSIMDNESINYLNDTEDFESKIKLISDNILAFLTNKKLILFDINESIQTRYDLPFNLGYNNIDKVGSEIFLSFNNGIVAFNLNNRSFDLYEFDDIFNKNFPRGFIDIEKVNNRLWVANKESGIHVFKSNLKSDIQTFSVDTSNNRRISSFSVNKINYNKNKGKALISTQGDGLFIYNTKDSIFTQVNKNLGIISDNIYDAEFANENIWVLTGKGINYFNENDPMSFKYEINKIDGLSILEYNNDPLRVYNIDKKESNSDDGIIDLNNKNSNSEVIVELIGIDSINSFNSNDIFEDSDPYNLSILNTRAFYSSSDYESLETIGGKIEIDSKINLLEIELFTNNKIKRDQVEFLYSHNSQTDEFKSLRTNNVLRIQSIPNYNSVLKIKAINKSGFESDNIIRLDLFKLPPWYQRTETIIAYIIFSILGIYFYSRWREKSASKKLEEERRSKELEEAKKLQNSLLPKSIPKRKDYDISVYLKSATEVGGDYYDFIENDKNELFVVCGDATGHGVVSGIMVSVTKAGLNGVKMQDPSTILNKLNSIVKRVNFGRLRMSLSIAKMNNGSVELSSAAMPPTYYYNSKQDLVEEILIPNLPLGGIEGEKFEGIKKDFNKGDVVVMISDGLPELPNRENILLDYQKVLECIEDNCNGSADKIKDALVDMSQTWADGNMNPDDITIVVVKKAS